MATLTDKQCDEFCNLITENTLSCPDDCITSVNNAQTKIAFLENETQNQSFLLQETGTKFDNTITNIQNSINIINKALIENDQNDLRTVIENDRKLADSNLQLIDSKIENVNTDLQEQLNKKASIVSVETNLSNVKTASEIKINSSYTQLMNVINDIKADLMLHETKLSYLVINKADLETKLNIISEITNLGTDENLNLINALSIENKNTAEEITTLSNYFAKLKVNIDITLEGINTLIKANEEKIINELTERKLDVKILTEDLTKIETKVDETLQGLRTDLDDFISIFNIKEQEINSKFADVIKLINDNYTKTFNMVETESKNRINSDNALEIKINNFVNQFSKDLQAIDYSKNFSDLNDRIDAAILTLEENNIKNIKSFADIYGQITKNSTKMDNLKNDLLARIDNAVQANKENYDNLIVNFDERTTTMNDKLYTVNVNLSQLETRIINLESELNDSGCTTLTTEAIADQLKTVQNSIVSNMNAINNLNSLMLDNKALVLKDVNDKNLIITNQVQDAINTANSALTLSEIGIDNVRGYVNRLEAEILDITAGVNIAEINLESLNNKILENFNTLESELNAINTKLVVGCNLLDLRVTVLETGYKEVKNTIALNDQNIRTIVDNLNKDFLAGLQVKEDKINLVENKVDTNYGLIVDNALKAANGLKILAEDLKAKDNEFQANMDITFNTLTQDINANTTLINTVKDTFDTVQQELNTSINEEYEARSLAIKNLDDKLVQEIDTRIAQAQDLQNQITIQTDKLSSVLDGSTEAFDSLKEILDYVNQLSGEKENMFTGLIQDIKDFKEDILEAINKETEFRLEADDLLNESIQNESLLRIESIEKVTALITQEVKDRLNAIQEVNTAIENQKIIFNDLLKIQENRIDTLSQTVQDNLDHVIELIDNTNLKIDTKANELLNLIAESKAELQINIDNTMDYVKDFENTNASEHDTMVQDISDINKLIDLFFGNYSKDNNNLNIIYSKIQDGDNELSQKITDSIIKAENDNNTLASTIKITTDELSQRLNNNISNLETETQNRISQDKILDGKITDNTNTIQQLDSDVNARIDSEIVDRENGDALLNNKLINEINTRTTQVNNLQNELNDLEDSVQTTKDNFTKTISDLSTKQEDDYRSNLTLITNETTDRKAQDSILETIINDEINRSVTKDIELEALANKNANDISKIMADSDASLDSFKEVKDAMIQTDTKFTTRINAAEATFKEADTNLDLKINKEISDRIADTDGIKTILNQEIQDRTNSVNDLAKVVSDNEIRQNTWNTNTTNTLNTEIQTRINDVKDIRTSLSQETSTRATAVQDLRNSLNKESNERLQADGDLSERITTNYNMTVNFTKDLDTERTERTSEDAKLQVQVDSLTQTVNGIFDGSTDDLNSFREIVDLINSTDFSNDANLLNFSKTVYDNIDELHTLISNEMNARAGEDNLIRIQLNNEIRKRIADFKGLVQDFEANKVEVAQENSNFKEVVIDTINDNNAQTDLIIKSLNDDFVNIRALIEAVNTDLLTEVKDRKYYINSLRTDFDAIMVSVEEKYAICDKNIQEAIYKIETDNKDSEVFVQNELTDQNAKIDNINLRIDDTGTKINNTINEVKTLVNQEAVYRQVQDEKLQNNIDLLETKVDNNDGTTNTRIDNLSSRVESILDGSLVDTEEFQKIVDVLNSIDPNTDIIRNIKDDINFKIANVNADMDLNKDYIEEEILNIKQEALGLITSMTEDYTNKFNTLKNDLLASIQNSEFNTNLEIDTLTSKLENELTARQGFYDSIKNYIDTSLQSEKTFRVTEDNNLNLKLIRETEARQNDILDLRKELQGNIDLNASATLDKILTLNNALNKEITNRTFITDSMLNTINTFINTNTNEINTFTKNINDRVNAFQEILGDGVTDYDNLSVAVQASLNKLLEIQQDVYDEIKNDIENGNITGISYTGTDGDGLSLDAFDTQSLLNTIDSRISTVVLQESNRAQTKELDLEAKIIQVRSDTDLSIDENTKLVKDITNDIIDMVNTKIGDFKNIVDTLDLNLKDTNYQLSKEVETRTVEYTKLESSIITNANDIDNTTSKLNELIITSNNQTADILASTTEIVNDKTSTLEQEFANLSKDLTDKSVIIDTKVQDFQNILLSLNNDEANLQTQVQDLRSIVEDILKDSSVDLNSVEEVVAYINQVDSDLLKVQNNIIKGTGLTDLGEFVTMINSHYLSTNESVYSCLDRLDEVIYANNEDRIKDIEKLTNDLNIEIQKRIGDVKALNLKIDTVQKLLQDQISSNRADIDVNTKDIKDLNENLNNEIQDRILNDNQMRVSIGLEDNNELIIDGSNYIDQMSVKNSLITLDTVVFDNTRNLQDQIGDLDDLDTENKDDLVQAINETLYKATHPKFGSADAFDDAFILQNL